MMTINWLLLMKVVDWLTPFQATTALLTKLLPSTVSVNGGSFVGW